MVIVGRLWSLAKNDELILYDGSRCHPAYCSFSNMDSISHAIWIGDAAEIHARYVGKQKTDKRDAAG
jgi:hypothetical protein